MFDKGAVTLMDRAELRADEFLDEHLQVTLDTGDVDAEQTANRVLFSRKLHYHVSQLVKDSAKRRHPFWDLEETLQEVLAARSHSEYVTFETASGPQVQSSNL